MMIELNDVTKTLGGQKVLDGATLQVEQGETMVIIGRSGAGKSVMLKHMIGLMQADRGQVLVNDVDVATVHGRDIFELRRQFGMLFQFGALINWLSVFDNVALPLREHTRKPPDEIESIVHDKLSLLDLAEHAEKMPSDISGGMRKRAGLARAIVLDPQILLYDEPTSGLDPVMASRIDHLIQDVKDKLDVTSVVVTHNMDSAYAVADRIAMLYDGKIVQVGTPDEIRNTDNPIVRQFIEGNIDGPIE
jgi:phospholipid/cholesterol/gamma-HCH transport system ATP-binding protein